MRRWRLPSWWPLAGLTLLAALLRFSTLDLQSLWYDEAFTPVHVLHASLGATLRAVVHSENTPPLWYVFEWGVSRVLGTGAVALRLLSALVGVATVPVAWAIGRELSGAERGSLGPPAAIAAAAFVAVNPLFVWYSQEARAYGLLVFTSALAILCFLRVERAPVQSSGMGAFDPSLRRRLIAFAASSSLALLTHYFAVFLVAPMAVWLLRDRARRRAALPAVGVVAAVCAALTPLVLAQGGHGAQWIERWALSSRLQAIPQYYLTGNSGAPLGHGIELLVALPILAGLGLGLWRVLEPFEERGALIALALSVCGVLAPILLVVFGADYLAPRNLVAAMIPVTAVIAVVVTARRAGRSGQLLAAVIAFAFLAISIDVDVSPRLQRGNWRGVARALGDRAASVRVGPAASSGRVTVSAGRVITTVELGASPLEYYLPGLRNLPRGSSVAVSEIDETGYAPLRPSAGRPPVPGFRLLDRSDVDGLIVYRFVSSVPREVSEAALRRAVITRAHPEVLVPPDSQIPSRDKRI
ncbi:MAG TPA: glycosyltransferase family 39 protein [Solirubrobacteraceae bacterium]|jgi:4-amino-4-deoxy-L-arabinose transferase-like glycosyltransferase